jgi:hypothetical protein
VRKAFVSVLAVGVLCCLLMGCQTTPIQPVIPAGCENSLIYTNLPQFPTRGVYVVEAGLKMIPILAPEAKEPLVEALYEARDLVALGDINTALTVLSVKLSSLSDDDRIVAAAIVLTTTLGQIQGLNFGTDINHCDQEILLGLLDRTLAYLDPQE